MKLRMAKTDRLSRYEGEAVLAAVQMALTYPGDTVRQRALQRAAHRLSRAIADARKREWEARLRLAERRDEI